MCEGESVGDVADGDGVADGMAAAIVTGAVTQDAGSVETLARHSARRRESGSGQVVPLVWPLEPRATTGLRFLGLRFDPLSLDEAATKLAERASSNKPFAYVVTPNVDHRVRLERESNLHAPYEAAWMSLCDSRVLALMARRDGITLPPAPGADLVEYLFENEVSPDEPINIIGSDAGVIAILTERYGLTRVRHHRPPMELRRDAEAIAAAAQFVADHPARFTFICVGSPQQELVAHRILRQGDAKGVGLCCGASLEFLTGRIARAPRWMRGLALEWLHRLATDPLRMYHRYLISGPRIFPIWLKSRTRRIDDVGDGGRQRRQPLRRVSIPPPRSMGEGIR